MEIKIILPLPMTVHCSFFFINHVLTTPCNCYLLAKLASRKQNLLTTTSTLLFCFLVVSLKMGTVASSPQVLQMNNTVVKT